MVDARKSDMLFMSIADNRSEMTLRDKSDARRRHDHCSSSERQVRQVPLQRSLHTRYSTRRTMGKSREWLNRAILEALRNKLLSKPLPMALDGRVLVAGHQRDQSAGARRMFATVQQKRGERPLRVLCHEYRRSKRRCATVREMKEGPSGSAIRSLIPSHRELLRSKAVVVSVAETSGL